jgi:hypothetical protein
MASLPNYPTRAIVNRLNYALPLADGLRDWADGFPDIVRIHHKVILGQYRLQLSLDP